MKVFIGEDLRREVLRLHPERFKQRDAMAQIDAYFNGDSLRTCALFGLRRTGKTVLMYQKIQKLNDYDRSCLISCEEGDTIKDLWYAMDDRRNTCEYFFLDEVTAVQSFATSSAFLADIFTVFRRRVLMAGTDSLAFLVAKADTLYDRVELIHTTFIPYREFHRLLGKSLDEYIEYGGTLTNGKEQYNDFGDVQEYTNTSIVKNIEHGLKYLEDWEMGRLAPVYKNGEIETYINKLLEIHNHSFLSKTIEKAFKSHDLGSLKQLLKQGNNAQDLSLLESPELTELIRKELSIKDELLTPDPNAMERLQKYLERIDLLIPIDSGYMTRHRKDPLPQVLFTQPGMRYAQAEGFTRALWQFLRGKIDRSLIESYQAIIENDIKGQLLEDILQINLLKDSTIRNKYEVHKYAYTTDVTTEFDLIMIEKKTSTTILFEVKHSKKQHPNQTKNLLSHSGCKAIRKMMGADIVGKAVVYLGETDKAEEGIMYVNAEEFLVNTTQAIEQIQEYYSAYIRNDKMKREESREQGMSR